jgi:ABC-2 type transport system ATP-binding protein
VLALENVSKSYGSRRVLDDITLQVPRGELLGYVGGNGAGKTTSMRIMLGVATADAGRVSFDGAEVDDALRSRIGYMPEERGLYPAMRLHHQLQFFAELRGVERRAAARAASYWLERLGLAERRDHRLEDLSLGNQQRVQLAAALVHEPAALVLDEPFSGLDPIAVDLMTEVLREQADRGVPVVFSSHQLDLVERICDRVSILRDGRVVASGEVAELATARTGPDRYVVRTTTRPQRWLPELEATLGRTDLVDPVRDGDDEASGDGDAGGHTVVLRITGADLDATIDVVRRHGRLVGLHPRRTTLTEVYRDLVEAA